MVKIFIGNLSQHVGKDEVEALFTQYGTVTECAKYKNYAFVHMEDRKAATKAIRELHLHKVNGRPINVELSRGRGSYQGPAKIHVANVERGFEKELRELFEEYGTVTECAIVKNFAFVHMLNGDEAMDAIQGLDNSEFQGKRIHVQLSKSRPRGAPEEENYPPPPGSGEYYPPHPPMDGPVPPFRGHMPAYPPPPPLPAPPRRAAYPAHEYGERDDYSAVDYYDRFRASAYSVAGYNDRHSSAIPPPPPPPTLVRERLGMGALDPYDRRPLPPPPQSSTIRDRSPIRRVPPPPPPPSGNGYSYERSRLSPLSRPPVFSAARPRDPVSERMQLPPPLPPPLPPRYAGY